MHINNNSKNNTYNIGRLHVNIKMTTYFIFIKNIFIIFYSRIPISIVLFNMNDLFFYSY